MSLEFDDRDRESVLRDLVSADDEVRRLAVERVGGLAIEEAIPRLIERLGDASWRVRKAAVERLVAWAERREAVSALIGALADGENPGRRNAAVEALIGCGRRALASLEDALGSRDPDVRKLVVDTLAGIGDAGASAALIRGLADADANVRAACADALGVTGGEGAERALLDAAVRSDEDPLVRFSALHALGALEVSISARALGAVLDDPVLQPAALGLLGREDEEEAIAVLLKGLASGSRASREAAMRSLLRLLSRIDGDRADRLASRIREVADAAPELAASAARRLEESDLGTRLVLVQFLGLVRARDAVLPLLRAGADEALSQVALAALEGLGDVAEEEIDASWEALDARARRDACALFERLGGRRSAVRLLATLDDPLPELRAAAARAVGRRRLPQGLAPLVRHLGRVAADDDFEAEEELAAFTDALIELASPADDGDAAVTAAAVELLAASLDGAAESVRLAVARVLGRIGRREDAEVVELLLKDPSAPVRRAAVDALARLEPGTAAEPLRLALADESAHVRIAAAEALGASEREEVIEDLMRLADDADPRVRAAAVCATARRFGRSERSAHRDAARRLIEGAAGDEAPVALAAVGALRELGGELASRAVGLLNRREPEVLVEAVRCLGVHARPEELDALLPLTSHPDWTVRAEAIQTLGERGVAKAVPAILRRLETEQDEFVRGAILRSLERLEG